MNLSDFEFKTVPYDHQGDALLVSADKEYFEIRGNSNTQNNGLYQVDDAPFPRQLPGSGWFGIMVRS